MAYRTAPRMRCAVSLLLCLLAIPLGGQPGAQNAPDIRSGVFRGRPVVFEVVDGLAILEGDIVLGRAAEIEAAPLVPPAKPSRREAVYRDGEQYLWSSGIIPYTIDPAIPNVQRVLDAIQHWNEKTPIRLTPRTGQSSYLYFRRQNSGGVCYSALGRTGGQQTIGVDDACGAGTLTHEIGHTVGFYHEQSRLDRDAYVRVLYENIESGRETQFDPPYSSGADLGRYDYASIMHYSSGAFSKNAKPTIVSVPLGIPFGQRSSLSAADIDAVNRLYATPPSQTTIATNPDGLEIIVDGEKFTAPRSFSWGPGTLHTIGVPSPVSGTGSSRWIFGRWSDDGEQIHAITADPRETVYTVNFIRQLPFTTKVSPADSGAVIIEPSSEDGYYPLGTELRITAVPAPGLAFSQWTLPRGRELHGRSANPAVVASAAYEYIANFTAAPLTTIATLPEGLPVTVDGETVLSPVSFSWAAGSNHSISVDDVASFTSVTDTRHHFQQWSDGGARSHAITASDTSTRYTASYRARHQLTLAITPSTSGTVEVSPSSDDGFYDEGASVALTASPATNYKFARWSGDLSGGENPKSLTVARPHSVTAGFGIPGQLTSVNVLSAATLLRGPAVPGGLFTILGVDIGPDQEAHLQLGLDGKVASSLAGTRVLLDGAPAPLVYVSRNQINAVAPFSLAGKTISMIAVETPGKQISPAAVPVDAARPGIFTLTASGSGPGAILNEDGTVNSPANPAARGSIIVLYATGAGQTEPAGTDGKLNTFPLPKPLLPVQVRIGGRLAEVYYAGAAPQLVAGVLQINARVPTDIVPGAAVPVVLMAGKTASPASVTVSVR